MRALKIENDGMDRRNLRVLTRYLLKLQYSTSTQWTPRSTCSRCPTMNSESVVCSPEVLFLRYLVSKIIKVNFGRMLLKIYQIEVW